MDKTPVNLDKKGRLSAGLSTLAREMLPPTRLALQISCHPGTFKNSTQHSLVAWRKELAQ
jgi:hypothetical protein